MFNFYSELLLRLQKQFVSEHESDFKSIEDLLEALLEIPNLYRIRFGSIESVEVSDELVELMATNKRVCPHLHLPLQASKTI